MVGNNTTTTLVNTHHPLIPKMPMIGLGTAGDEKGEMADTICAATKDCGVRLIDTAQNYGSQPGIGKGLAASKITQDEDKLFVSTKVDLASAGFENASERVRRQVKRSLDELGLKYLDGVVIHWPICLDKVATEEENKEARKGCWKELEKMVGEGVVKNIGVSNWTVELLEEMLEFATIKPQINQIELSPACPQKEIVDFCQSKDIVVMGYSPYGGCWIADSWPKIAPWAYSNLIWDDTVKKVAEEVGCSAAQVLNRWAIQRGCVPIPKSVKPSRITESLKTLDDANNLSDEQIATLNTLQDDRRGVASSIKYHKEVIGHPDFHWTPT